MTSPSKSTGWQAEALLGMRLFLPLALSIASYGVVWGVLAGHRGLGVLEVLLMSGLVYAGSSQFVALDLWVPGHPPILAIVVATAVINLRMLLMSATLRPLVAHLRWYEALPLMFFVSDEQWAMTMSEWRKGRAGAAFMLGVGVLAWVAWVASTLTGRLAGAFIAEPERYGLDFAFTATFIALLLGMWKGRGDIVPWVAGAAIAMLVARLVPGNWYIIAGGLGGSLAGALFDTLGARRDA